MSALTTQGKEVALKELGKRRKKNENKKKIDDSSLPAGSPMHFDCLTCNATISVPEDYFMRSTLCKDCQDLKSLGWLD